MSISIHYLLTQDQGDNIAVIRKKGKASPAEFNKAIKLAIKEHFCVSGVNVHRKFDDMLFKVSWREEDGPMRKEEFILSEIEIY